MGSCREPLAYCRRIGIFVIKLYSKPVCFCGYFIPQWVVDHELKNFQWFWFRKKIPDYGRFYPRISCKMQFRGSIPSYIPLPTLFLCNFLWWWRRITVTWLWFFYWIFFNFTVTHFHFLRKHRPLLRFQFLLTCVEFPFPTANVSCK